MLKRMTWLCLLAVLSATGCHDPATAQSDGRPLSTRDADRQYKSRLLELIDGKTTRADVIAVMGDPDREETSHRIILYSWDVKSRDYDNLIRSYIIAQFNPDGVLTRHSETAYEATFGGPKLQDDALAEFLGVPTR